MDMDRLQSDLIKVLELAGIPCGVGDLEIEDLGVPHVPPTSLPPGTMAVYSFYYGDRALKIGKAGPNSKARYTSQHYRAGSAPSTLAASLEGNPARIGLVPDDVSDSNAWLKDNTRRINFIINAGMGVDALNLIEAFLIAKFEPVYEGFDSQRRSGK